MKKDQILAIVACSICFTAYVHSLIDFGQWQRLVVAISVWGGFLTIGDYADLIFENLRTCDGPESRTERKTRLIINIFYGIGYLSFFMILFFPPIATAYQSRLDEIAILATGFFLLTRALTAFLKRKKPNYPVS